MSRVSVLRLGRRSAERGMADTCTIRRKTGETEGAGGVIDPTWDDLYDGKCRVQVRTETGQATDVGESELIIERREVQLPIAVTGLLEGDRITITASRSDPDLVGRAYVIRDVVAKTDLTARRASVIEVTS